METYEHWWNEDDDVFDAINDLYRKVHVLMAGDAEIAAAVQTLKGDVSAALADLAAKVTALQGQIPDPAAAQGILDAITALDTDVKGSDPGPQPAPPPAPAGP